jgi:single stranded DNA-binding protein
MSLDNSCRFTGRLGKKPKVKEIDDELTVVTAAIAVNDWRKKDDEDAEPVWVPLTIWNKSGEAFAKLCTKGTLVQVDTEYNLDRWEDDDGNERVWPKFTVREWKLLSNGRDPDDDDYDDDDEDEDERPARSRSRKNGAKSSRTKQRARKSASSKRTGNELPF